MQLVYYECDLNYCFESFYYFSFAPVHLIEVHISFPVSKTCKLTRFGVEYGGTMSTTTSGKTCQRWDQQSPHQHEQTDAIDFPTILSLDQAENYCRLIQLIIR